MIVFIIGACSSEPEMDKTKFRKLDEIAQELQTSHAAGASYQHFGELLQNLSAEIAAVKNKELSKKELELLQCVFCSCRGLSGWLYSLEV